MKEFILLIDIDGTICEDIKNEDSHLYPSAKPLPGAIEKCNQWYESGAQLHFFTARESKDREVTELWLRREGFQYHSLVMDKPRIKDGEEYIWIDNRKVRAITFK
jgi:predicted secreted acid phosphatase